MLRSTAAHTHPLPPTAPSHPPEILKGLKFKQRSTSTTPVSGGGLFTPGVALAIIFVFAKFKERGFIPKTITWPRPRPFRVGFFYLWGGTCRSRSTYLPNLNSIASSIPEIFEGGWGFKICKRVTWPRPRPFQGKFFTTAVNPATQPICQIWRVWLHPLQKY